MLLKMTSRIGSVASLALVSIALVVVSAASATAPGKNGAIVFRRYFDDQQTWGAVFTIEPDGTHAQQITHPPQGIVDDQPDWAPDGSLISFTRCAPNEGLCHVWTVAPDGTGIAPVGPLCPTGAKETRCPDDGHPDFSPDSKRLVFVQSTGRVKQVPVTGQQIEHSAIAVMNRDGSNRHVVYTTRGFTADLDYPVFSPDGKQIVFERHNSGLSRPIDKHAVFVIGADGSNLHRLTPWVENDGDNPDWSPDGKWILYHSHVEDPAGQAQYFLVHPDGSGRRQITHFPSGTHLGSAAFSPDGGSIVFSKGPEGGNIDVFTMHSDGTHLQRVTRSRLWDSAPDWGPAPSSGIRKPSAARTFPTGAWRVTVTKHDLLTRGVIGSDVSGNYGVWNWALTRGRFVEHQQETVSGPVVDRHRGTYTVTSNRVCFTDTGEQLRLGCFNWTASPTRLTYTDPTFNGPIAQGDGPGIMRAIFTAHPWRKIARVPARATEKFGNDPAAFTVKSTLDGTTVVPARVHWIAQPSLPSSRIREVDFLIDGELRWVERRAPYSYGSDGDWLVTSFLTPGMHRFSVRATTTDGRSATDVRIARVTQPDPLPSGIAGNWRRRIGADVAGADLAGTWKLRITSVGWRIVDPKRAPSLIDVAYLGSALLESRGPIWTAPMGPPGSPTEGNGWCDAPFPPVRYRYTTTGTTLTLQLVGNDLCGGEHRIWAGTWSRSH